MPGPIPTEERFWQHVRPGLPEDECWPWFGHLVDGYGHIRDRGRGRGAHRVSWEMHRGPIPPGLYVCHRCDNRRCVNPAHLFLGTPTDNNRDREAKGRGVRGRQRLTEADVRRIRERCAAGERHRAVGADYGVGKAAIFSVVHRKTWRHVP